ncbi:MAG: hypothetical protein HYW89_01400 [Candidatus Sungiibacteriota bacterium]|uniref:Apea-like HEPN domain-containing protein n=1 Tax=Candidatus Sungiibacteriota bacterium TaxID=2750080 RepID=A0A7T5RK32_9BACT|nr:MAG: hypothetical protein HYW89_01400 [Candidatus Sungbacteria bacterium]
MLLNFKPIDGRYNTIGEWKPLIYVGDSSPIQREVRELCKNEKDKRIDGCLFYIAITSHQVIEFVVVTNFEIPNDFITTTVGKLKIELHKIAMPVPPNSHGYNTVVYDGTAYLLDHEIETIRDALDVIGVLVNRMAFRIRAKAIWFQKYDVYGAGHGKSDLSDEDFEELRQYMLGLKTADAAFIDTAISWYTTGRSATNESTQFMNYYIAVESLAIVFVDGMLDASKEFGIEVPSASERKQCTAECIRRLHDALYQADPSGFVTGSYSQCIRSLRAKTELALAKVFGEDHEFTKGFFDSSEGKSIYRLRNDLAHGNFNLIDRDELHQIRNKLPLLEDIAFAFIMRLSLGKNQKYKKANRFSMSIKFDSPRDTKIASNLNMFPRKDWRIQWEWLI